VNKARNHGLEGLQDSTEGKGYKRTEVGVIPDGWEVKRLTYLCETIVDCAHSTPAWTINGVIVLRNQNIRNGRLDLSNPSYTDETHFIKRTKRAIPMSGDLVITREAPIGEVCTIPRGLRCCLGQRMVLLRPNREKCDSCYLLYGLQSESIHQAIKVNGGTGSTVSNLRIPLIEALPIPLPPLPEQKAIALCLSDTDELIAACDRAITKKRNIKQGAMQQLLTGKKRLPGFSGEWKVEELGNVALLERGKFSARPRNDPKFFGGDIPFIQTGDVTKSNGIITTYNQSLNHQGLRVSKLFPSNTLFFTIAANIGDIGIASFETACPDSLIAITPQTKVDKQWLFYALKSRKKSFEGLATQNAQLNINLEKLNPYLLPVPPVSEQKAIAQILSDMDAEIAALEKKRDKYKAIKQGMMQELLTGKTRLIDR